MKKYILLFFILLIGFSSCDTEEPVPTYTLNLSVSPSEGGKITVSPQTPSFKEGEVVTLTPEPNEHWVFKQWEGDGSGSTTPLQLTMNSNKSVVGVFVKRDYPLNLKIEGEGTVEVKIITSPSGREYPHGTTVQLNPKPKEGWVFESWGGDLSGTASPKNITVDKEKNVTVKFVSISNFGTFFLHPNGVTCMCPNAKVGEKGIINGVEYEAVDNSLLRKRRDEGKDMTKLCTSLVTNMVSLFSFSDFNQPIGNWDVSNVSNMTSMFGQNLKFNQPIGHWNVSKVTSMKYMFFCDCNQKSAFNQSLTNWDVSNVTDMTGMFGITSFNQPIGNWDVGKVTNMSDMFTGTPFNQPIGNWNVSNVTNMNFMFEGSQFNQPIGNWNVNNVTDMMRMFNGSSFNQNISKWCVTNIKSEPQNFSSNSPLTTANKPKWGTCPN